MSTRADGLRAVIDAWERGEKARADDAAAAFGRELPVALIEALDGSLDAVARLEAPLRERGWTSTVIDGGEGEDYGWAAVLWSPGLPPDPAEGEAPAEARARLLAVLKALLWEEEHP